MECLECGNSFTPKQKTQKFCSKKCKTEFNKYSDNTCESCGNVFRGVKGRKYCSTECRKSVTREERKCKKCGNTFIERIKHDRKFCSTECRVEWTNLPENREKQQESIKKTVRKRYGVDHVWEVKEIHKKTMENRDVNSSVEKQKNTVREKHLNKLLPKLSDNGIKLLDEYTTNKEGNTSISYNFECLSCNHKFQSTLLGCGVIPTCVKCYPNNKNTSLEIFITDFLNENGIKYVSNSRKIISPYELDIYIPEHRLGIELNGMYWHGELNGKDKNYHLNKTKLAHNKKIELLHIFDEEIINKPKIVLSKLRNKLDLINKRIYARKCHIKEIDSNTKSIFLNRAHIQGGNTKDSVSLGLFYEDILVSVMSFSKRKITRGKPTWEITRFASELDTVVVGGFSKLLKNFILKYKPTNLITYADLRWSSYDPNKTVYNKNGFTYKERTKPNYWYFYRSNNKQKFHRYTFRKSILVSEGFDSNKTEWEIMKERGFDRIWDCGNLKYVYKQ